MSGPPHVRAMSRVAGAYRALTRRERVDALARRLDLLEEAVAETVLVERRLEPELRHAEELVLGLADPDPSRRKG